MFAAGTVSAVNTRDSIITQLRSYAISGRNNTPIAVVYDPTSASAATDTPNDIANSGKNSPAVGAMFSLLALK